MLPILPDAETLVIQWIKNHPGVVPLLVGGRVGTTLRAERPFVQVNRVGGPADGSEDNPRVQVSVWHNDDTSASLLARTILAATPDLVGPQVRAVGVILAPFSQPDEDNHRYIMDLELLTYAGG